MFGIFTSKLFFNWFLLIITFMLGAIALSGFNTVTRSFDIGRGIASTWETFGGLTLLYAAGGILVIALIAFGASRLQNNMYVEQSENKKQTHLVATILIALVILTVAIWAAPFIQANISTVVAVVVFLAVTFGFAQLTLRGVSMAPHEKKVEAIKTSSTAPVH